MSALSTREVAAELGTSPKVLRQFLRQDDTFGGVGSGARYAFTSKDLPRLKKRFAAWQGNRALTTTTKVDHDGQPGLPLDVLGRKDERTRAMIKKQAEERVDRLEKMLKERGLHISQTKR